MLGLRFCARAFSSCSKRGLLFIVVRGPLTVAASLVAENRLQTHRLSNCGSRAQLLCGMWDLPRPGLEPVSPALAGRFSTTAPLGKPSFSLLVASLILFLYVSFYLFLTFLCTFIFPQILPPEITNPANSALRCPLLSTLHPLNALFHPLRNSQLDFRKSSCHSQ